MDSVSKVIAISSLAFLVIISFPNKVSAGAQIDVGVGENRFFLGEQFLITFKDVVYWMAGMCMGFILATTFVIITDYDGAFSMLKESKLTSSRNRGGSNELDSDESRDTRLIGSKKYPTHLEERILKAVDTEPENYIRQRRLIGGEGLPTGMEERVLKKLESPDNKFAPENSQKVNDGESQPSPVSRLLQILYSLPALSNDDSNHRR